MPARGHACAGRALALALMVVMAAGAARAATEEEEYNRAWTAFQSGRTADAIAAFKKLIGRHPSGRLLPEAHFTLARIDPSGNNAFSHYQLITDNYPAHPLASQSSYAIAQYYLNLGVLDEARARYIATYGRYGQSPAGCESLYRLALLALDGDSASRARAYAQAILEQHPGSGRGPTLFVQLAEHCLTKGDTAGMRSCWRTVADRYPTSPEADVAREKLTTDSDTIAADATETVSPPSPPASPAPAPPAASAPEPQSPPAPAEDSPAPSPKQPINESPSEGKFLVQVGAYRSRPTLLEWKKRLADQGFPVTIDSTTQSKDAIYRLKMGPYRTRQDAEEGKAALKERLGVDGMLLER